MKCSRITLRDRKEQVPKELEKQTNNYQRQYQPQMHNYLSWLNKPHTIYEEQQPSLTICNLVLPKNISVFVDRGAQSEKWTQKRPRLQSGKTKQIFRKPPESVEIEDVKVSQDEDEEKDSECMEIQQIIEDYEIDENVQRLIQEAADYDQKMEEEYRELERQREMDDEVCKKRQRKSSKHSLKDTGEVKSRITRTVTLSLSRAPSPETIQVIRVDVTSNYSLDEIQTMHNGEEDGQEQMEEYEEYEMKCNRLQKRKSLINHEPAELTLHCQKLALSERMTSNYCQ
ncbi:hypothetical protein CBL_06889 [Carabus blaptoides fortunei]